MCATRRAGDIFDPQLNVITAEFCVGEIHVLSIYYRGHFYFKFRVSRRDDDASHLVEVQYIRAD